MPIDAIACRGGEDRSLHEGKEDRDLQVSSDSIAIGHLPVAGELAERLAGARVRFGLYKNVGTLDAGLGGHRDLDLLVAADDAAAFRSVMLALGGVCGVPSPLYDNAVAGREDWFLPDASGGYLHLDASFGLRIGRKYCKRYLAFAYTDVSEWRLPGSSAPPVPFVGPIDAARIAVLRSLFRLPLWPGQAWVKPDGDSHGLLEAIFSPGQDNITLDYRFGECMVSCLVRRRNDGFVLEGAAIRRMRRVLRASDGLGALAAPLDFLMHNARRLGYFAARLWTGARPGRSVARRRLDPAGVVVALVGPDGVGKSTQTARLAATFGRKFRCAAVYLGSNDGDWMRFRAALRERLSRASRPRSSRSPDSSPRKREKRSGWHVLGSAIWRLVIAVQRQTAMRKAMRFAAAGAIVITDRWPQTLRCGYLDGPSVPPPPEMRLANLLSRIEHSIYRAMERHKPTLTIHLDCDFATSHARKPGDITQEDFELRIELMEEMRRRDPGVVVVDARLDHDKVSAQLIRHVWSAAHKAGSATAPASSPLAPRLEPLRAVL
jgi:thymidylate kinase